MPEVSSLLDLQQGLDDYRKTHFSERILLLPHCLRKEGCPTKTSSEWGMICQKCENCDNCKICELVDFTCGLEIGAFVAPGGSLAQRIVERIKPKAILAVACPKELSENVPIARQMGMIVIAVPLMRDGCVETDVDVKQVKDLLLLRESLLARS